MKTLQLQGKVFSGKSEAAKFIDLPWVKKQIEEKLGFIPYSGTLNIKLIDQSNASRKALDIAGGMEILPDKGFCRGKCFQAYLMDNLKCAVVVPEVDAYPKDIIEIVAPIDLRHSFSLKDGDVVGVKIMF